MSDPPPLPLLGKMKGKGERKAAFGGRRPQRSNMKGRAGLTHAFYTSMHRLWQAQAAEVGWRHPRAQPNQQTPGICHHECLECCLYPKGRDFHTFCGVSDGSHSLMLLGASLRGFLCTRQFCPGSPEGSAGRKQQKPSSFG